MQWTHKLLYKVSIQMTQNRGFCHWTGTLPLSLVIAHEYTAANIKGERRFTHNRCTKETCKSYLP